jgi:glutathione S-transferase
MQLYYCDVLAPRKACAAAKYLGLGPEYIYLDLANAEHKSPDYQRLNPNGKVPCLVDGDIVLWEADAIMCHLSNRAGADFWPHDARQIDVLRWLSWNAYHFSRCSGELYFQHVIKPRFNAGPLDEAAVGQAQAAFAACAAILDAHLATRPYLVGDSPTAADFSVAVALPYAEQARMPLRDFPAVHAWHERLNELQAWREPFPFRANRDGDRE